MPNITGIFSSFGYVTTGTSGAFRQEENLTSFANDIDPNAHYYDRMITLSAALSNSIYGAANTVQPPALVLLAQIRY